MASYNITKLYTTISILTTGDDITTRGAWVRIKNLGANAVSFSEAASPTGAATAGNQSTINPASAGGKTDDALIPPYTQIFFKAATAATLIGLEELYNLPQKT